MPDTKTSINYIYQVSKRKTIGIKICSKDTIKVSFPSGYRSQAEAFVLKKQPWITKKLSDIADRFSNTPNFESLMTQLSDKKSVEQKVGMVLDRLVFWKKIIAANYKEVDVEVLTGLAFTTSYWGICQTRKKRITTTNFVESGNKKLIDRIKTFLGMHPRSTSVSNTGSKKSVQKNLLETRNKTKNSLENKNESKKSQVEKSQVGLYTDKLAGYNSNQKFLLTQIAKNTDKETNKNPVKKVNAKILINASMIFLVDSPEILDYLCIHELCHLRVSGHGQKFWLMVEEFCQDYKTLRKNLKKHSHLLEKENISQLKSYFAKNWGNGFFDLKI